MSVPKVRRVPSPHHVSDRLRRARNHSRERNTITHLENKTEKSFKSYESTARIQMTSRSSVGSNRYPGCTSDQRQLCELKHSHDERSIKLPERVLKLVVTPCTKNDGHCSSFSASHGNDNLNVVGIYTEVLKELKQDVKRLDGVNAYVPYTENPILGLINNCFQERNNYTKSSSVLDSQNGLLQYAKTLTVECVEIIERVIHQQSDVVVDLNKESNISTRKKIKTLLLNVMLGIEHELINSEKILDIVDTDLHYHSFQFIYCLLKHFIERIASYLKLSKESDLSNPQCPDNCFAESNTFMHTVSGQASAVIPDQKVEEYSNRLDKLMKQWTGTGDSCCKTEQSQQVVIDCYHCLTDKKDQDLLLKTVSRFTEEIKRKLIECHRGDMRTQFPESSKTDDQLETPKIKEQSNDTMCSTEMSTYYSWSMASQNRSRRDSSRNWSDSNCLRPSNHLPNRSNCLGQECTRNRGSNYRGHSPPVARGDNRSTSPPNSICNNYRSVQPPVSDRNDYCSKLPTMANGSNNRSTSPPIPNGNHNRSMDPPMAVGNSYRSMSPPMVAGNNHFTMSPPLANSRNYRSLAPRTALKPFPKLQLPNFDLCKTIGTQGCSHVPRINPVGTNQMHKLCSQGNQMIGNNCGKCLVICENNPKPPYYDRFPGFKDAGLYGSKYVNTVQPQLFNSFSVSPEYGDEKKADKNSKKGQNKERKNTTSDKERKSITSKERRSISPFKGRRSLSPNIGSDGTKQMDGRKSENRRSPTRNDKKQDNGGGKRDSKAKKENPQKEQSPDRDVSKNEIRIPENENDSMKAKKSDKNKDDPTKLKYQFGDVPPARVPSHTDVPSTSKSADLKKPLLESKSREVADGKASSSKPSDTDRKKIDDHCTCCKCKKNNGNDDNSSMLASPCHCNGMNNQDSGGCPSRPIYQFFANPAPVACNCQKKSDNNKSPSEVSQKKRDSQDAETQTGKKPRDKSDTNLSGPYHSEPSTGQITPAQSKNEQEPCIENSESCTCTVIYSRSSSRHRRDSENVETQTQKVESKHSNKSDSKCACPRDIEDVFQEFDDKYSKCVQEIKLLIREGYISRFNGSDESFTVTREIKITPSKSKSACKDENPSKVPPQQQLRFQESQDKMYSNDSYRTDKYHDNHQSPPDLREDIEELKRLVKNTRIGHCPCCKCCKCANDGKAVEECSKDKAPVKDSSDSKKQSDPKEPGKYQSESSLSRSKPSKRYSSKEIDESNKEPPEGAKVIHISPSYVEDELPPSVQELITTPESTQTKASSSERDNLHPPSKHDTKKNHSPPQSSDGKINQPSTGTTRTPGEPNKYTETKSESGKVGSDKQQLSRSEVGKSLESPQKGEIRESDVGSSSKPVTVSKTLDKPQWESVAGSGSYPLKKSEFEIADVSAKKGDFTESEFGLKQLPVVKSGGSKAAGRALTSESGQGLEISDDSLPKESGMKVSKISVGDGKLSIVISNGTQDTNIKSDVTTAGSSADESDTDKIMERDNKETTEKKEGLQRDDGLKTEERSETSLQDESKFLQNQNAESRTSKKPLVETKPESVGYDKKSIPGNQQKKVTLVYDDEANKQRQMSLERQALNESREQLFSKRRDNNVPIEREGPRDDEVKKSWNPFESIFGVFGGKDEEGGTFKRGEKGDNIEEYSNITDDEINEESMSQEPKSSVACERDDDGNTIDSDFSSCAVGHPCGSSYSSCSTIDECRELLDSLPCNFYSDESVTSSFTEVIKETETELYVMIIESQPPVAQATDRHDEIISLLLSGNNNNGDFSGNGNTENHSTQNHLKTTITLDNVPHTSTTNRSYYTRRTYQNDRGSQHYFPVELITSQRSYESVTHGSDIESSDERLGTSISNDQPLSITRISPPSLQNIQQEMKERKSHSKQQEEKEHPRPCRNQPEKKKRHNTQKHSGDIALPSLGPQIAVEEVESSKKTENKEVQVTKWNAKVQTAGPRKFNRTDIPREVEDKLAEYLGLERTVEQMDLKVTPLVERARTLRDADDKGKSNKEESKRTSGKNRRSHLKFRD